ncbi:hypothetical protein PIB30_098552 [Stylosanthes scabra]|uniref:Uncharacterized protein n=1 Tax=Stylosanthes scabra TaxID=79078 RepID=A0ABU6QWX4_9FABA|nr:hypothetical protein [Stylosanthes scabra]
MFITKWARNNNVPRFPGDVMVKIPMSQQFFPYGKWREDDEEVAPPVPPLAAPVDVPAPSAPSSPEPSRKELMRTLQRNEHIMHISQNPHKVKGPDRQKSEMWKRMTTSRVLRQLGMLTHMQERSPRMTSRS